ncbi:acetylcholine receptor subunit alpha-like [Ylistrum balloti]|uniref:acetylcholine receptor subunit alpha-like n=1 Tax=Ylistrum balloti TaxID=509963 RepID=UPI0029059981|nr:acetylcholine receptor subunit alpha-like [Ylistrum balloti]
MTRLMDNIFSNYSRDLRPARNLEDTVLVNTTLFLFSILDVDELASSITLSGGLNMLWKDFRLSWQPDDYGGIQTVMVNSSKIWAPKIFLLSSSANMEKFDISDFDARIYNSGYILVNPGKMIRSTCEIDMTNFPNDSQKCSLLIVPWGYVASEIQLSFLQPRYNMQYLSPNGEWNVESISANMPESDESSVIEYKISLTRKSVYFIFSMIMPVYILCFLHPFVFLLPAASGERISYSITMFLSLAVYMTIVSDSMPKVSEPMAGISYFLLVAMLFSCVLIILTIFSLRWDAKTSVSQFPGWLKRIVLRFKIKDREICNIESVVSNAPTDNVPEDFNNDPKYYKNIKRFIDDQTDLEKGDIVTFIDNVLFVTSEMVVIGLIAGFILVYNK